MEKLRPSSYSLFLCLCLEKKSKRFSLHIFKVFRRWIYQEHRITHTLFINDLKIKQETAHYYVHTFLKTTNRINQVDHEINPSVIEI